MNVTFRRGIVAHLDLQGYKGKWDRKVRTAAVTGDISVWNKYKCVCFQGIAEKRITVNHNFLNCCFCKTVSGDKGDTCVQCEGTSTPGLPGPPGPKGDTGELSVVTFKFEIYF